MNWATRTRASSLTLLLIVVLAMPALARRDSIYPFPLVNTATLDQYEQFQMRQGWFEDQLTWFITTDVSNVKLAFDTYFNYTLYWMGVTSAPRLTETLQGVPIVYIITNYSQGPVFTTAPADPVTGGNYAGVWKAVLVTWKPEADKRTVTNARAYDPVTNPTGLPPGADAEYDPADPDDATLVVDSSIVALGPLGGPWYPAPSDTYRIPQGKVMFDYAYTKIIWLPYWFAYCTDPITRHVSARRFIVPDVFEPESVPQEERLIPRIGANPAPGLSIIPLTALRALYFMNDPKPWSQYPLTSSFPSDQYEPWRNAYLDYTPVAVYDVLSRHIPPYSMVNNLSLLEYLMANPPLPATPLIELVRDSQTINAPILPTYGQVP